MLTIAAAYIQPIQQNLLVADVKVLLKCLPKSDGSANSLPSVAVAVAEYFSIALKAVTRWCGSVLDADFDGWGRQKNQCPLLWPC